MLKIREYRGRLLAALLIESRTIGLNNFINVQDLAERFGLAEPIDGQLRVVMQELDARQFVNSSQEIGGRVSCILKSGGIEEAEDLLEAHPDYASPLSASDSIKIGIVPAADRYVALNHNQTSLLQIELSQLQDAVLSDNEVADEDRLIAKSEIAIFEASIISPRVPLDIIERFVSIILTWIRKKFSEALVGTVISRIIEQLIVALPTQ